MVVAVKRSSSFELGWASWNLGKSLRYRTSPNMEDISGKQVVFHVDWIWNFRSRKLDPTSVL